MGVFQNNLMGAAAAAASAGGGDFYSHQIANSVRFNASATAHMYHTQGTPTNVDKCTISFWVKRAKLGAARYGMTGSGASGDYTFITFGGDGNDPDKFYYLQDPGSPTIVLESNPVFRDPSAWYNIILANDSTQSTDSDRNKIYINGVQLTDWGTGFTPSFYSTQNSDFLMNTSGHKIFVGSGADSAGNAYLPFDGYIAEYVFIDGTQYASTDFGESKNGVWIPKDPSGLTFGNNGCYLKFESSSDLGNDSSGNNNDFTVSNVSAHDQMLDSPTFNSDSNGGNFCTLNSAAKHSTVTLSEGNLRSDCNNASIVANVESSYGFTSGKIYFEMTNNTGSNGSYPVMTVTDASSYNFSNTAYYGYGVNRGGDYIINASNTANVGSLNCSSTSDIRMFAIDFDNSKLWAGKNGTWYNTSGTSYTNSTGPESGNNYIVNGWNYDVAKLFTGHNDSSCGVNFNFGQDGTFAGNKTAQGNSDATGYGNFYYTVPDGFLAVCSGNQPVADAIDPAQTDDNFPQKLFGAKLYTGTGSTNALTGLGFQPDWVWIKERGGANNHMLFDSNRGTSKYLSSNTSGDEGTDSATMNTFGSDGFTVGSDGKVNASSDTYVAWNWRANGGGSSNSDGATSSTVQADPSGAFSIVTYTGFAGASGTSTVGHGMGVAPNMIIFKSRTRESAWWTAVPGVLSSQSHFLQLNATNTPLDLSSYGTISAPTTSVFSINGVDGIGGESANYVAYCFANVEGFCQVGTYKGNGDDDGAFTYTGFRPAVILIREYGAADNWLLYNNKTLGYNLDSAGNAQVYPDTNVDEENQASRAIDILSNGFKIRTSNATGNASDGDYVYLALAHNPFKYATAR